MSGDRYQEWLAHSTGEIFEPEAPDECPHCGVPLSGMNSNADECLSRPCGECGHPVYLHADRYGCQFERGDAWVDGDRMGGWVAQGPCGCTKHQLEACLVEANNVLSGSESNYTATTVAAVADSEQRKNLPSSTPEKSVP